MTKTNKTAFGVALRRAREKAGKSQGQVAKFLQVTTQYVSDVERGMRAPLTSERLMEVARLLDADARALVAARARYHGSVEVPLCGDADLDAHAVSLAVQRMSER